MLDDLVVTVEHFSSSVANLVLVKVVSDLSGHFLWSSGSSHPIDVTKPWEAVSSDNIFETRLSGEPQELLV